MLTMLIMFIKSFIVLIVSFFYHSRIVLYVEAPSYRFASLSSLVLGSSHRK